MLEELIREVEAQRKQALRRGADDELRLLEEELRILKHAQNKIPTLKLRALKSARGGQLPYMQATRAGDEVHLYPENMLNILRADGRAPKDNSELEADEKAGKKPRVEPWGVAEVAGLLCNEALHFPGADGKEPWRVEMPIPMIRLENDPNDPTKGSREIFNLPSACAQHAGGECKPFPLRFADHLFCVVVQRLKPRGRPHALR